MALYGTTEGGNSWYTADVPCQSNKEIKKGAIQRILCIEWTVFIEESVTAGGPIFCNWLLLCVRVIVEYAFLLEI